MLHPSQAYTPDQIHNKLFGPLTPITSVRRSITTLTANGYLRKTEIKKEGRYGKPNYAWILNSQEVPQLELW